MSYANGRKITTVWVDGVHKFLRSLPSCLLINMWCESVKRKKQKKNEQIWFNDVQIIGKLIDANEHRPAAIEFLHLKLWRTEKVTQKKHNNSSELCIQRHSLISIQFNHAFKWYSRAIYSNILCTHTNFAFTESHREKCRHKGKSTTKKIDW